MAGKAVDSMSHHSPRLIESGDAIRSLVGRLSATYLKQKNNYSLTCVLLEPSYNAALGTVTPLLGLNNPAEPPVPKIISNCDKNDTFKILKLRKENLSLKKSLQNSFLGKTKIKLRLEKASKKFYDFSVVMNIASTCGPHRQDPQTCTGLYRAGLESML